MAEIPNPNPMGAYAAYPRSAQFGTSAKLRSLFRGYTGLTYTFFLLLLAFALYVFASYLMAIYNHMGGFLSLILVSCAVYFGALCMGIRSGQDVATGSDWSKNTGLLVGFVCPIFGLIPILIVQYLAIKQMKKYGIRNRSFGAIKKNDVMAKIDELANIEAMPTIQRPSAKPSFEL